MFKFVSSLLLGFAAFTAHAETIDIPTEILPIPRLPEPGSVTVRYRSFNTHEFLPNFFSCFSNVVDMDCLRAHIDIPKVVANCVAANKDIKTGFPPIPVQNTCASFARDRGLQNNAVLPMINSYIQVQAEYQRQLEYQLAAAKLESAASIKPELREQLNAAQTALILCLSASTSKNACVACGETFRSTVDALLAQ